jgi:hypothetical protein
MPAPPYTHHEILGLVGPFTRAGRHLDLARSHRLERRLVFRAVEHQAAEPDAPALSETLQLEDLGAGRFRLTRRLTPVGGPQATLEASGPDAGELLAQIETVAPQRQFRAGPGYLIARSFVLEPAAGASADGAPAVQLILTQGIARLDGLSLRLTVLALRGVAADLALLPSGADAYDLPEDLLAVLGWDWARLIRTHEGWTSKLRLRGKAPQRSRTAEIALDLAAEHLARTLAEPPRRYHERQAGARWGVMLRRAAPTLTAVVLVTAVALLPHMSFENGPGPWLLLFHLPTALLVLSFWMQELSQFEIPPRPRRSDAASWRVAPNARPDARRRARA